MKITGFSLLFFMISGWSLAQNNKNVEDHQLTLNVLLPGVVY
nr:hypothetical protein [Allomuricauda sp.]